MTCIDAAIIKALVEHIGGNPDDVVVGGGSNESFIPIQWTTVEKNGYNLVGFTLPDGVKLQDGDRLVLNITDDGEKYTFIGYLSDSVATTDGPYQSYTFTGVKSGMKFELDTDSSVYICNKIAIPEVMDALPDNQSTGISHSDDPLRLIIFKCIRIAAM